MGYELTNPLGRGMVWIEMPLADHSSPVARFLQALGDGKFIDRQRNAAIRIQAEALLVASGKESGARGNALGCGDVTVSAACAIGCHIIEMWRLHILEQSLATKVRVAVIVGENDDDVRLFCGGERDGAEEE